jgi:thiosulfate/3-mercaptopyruvate sulfurtransferase
MPVELPTAEALETAFEAAGVSDDSRVVVYGDMGGLAAARAFFTLDYLGHPPAILDGGLEAWRAGGHRVDTSVPPAPARGSLTPTLHPDRLVDAEWVRGHLRDSTVALIDARPPEQFSGATPGQGITRPGHLPGAHNLFWQNTLASPSNPVLRSPDVLRALFRLSGARFASDVVVLPERPRYTPEDTSRAGRRDGRRPPRQRQAQRGPQPKPVGNTVVVYCLTGLHASWDYYVARYLGYDVKLYDGSYSDWSRRGPDYPVER